MTLIRKVAQSLVKLVNGLASPPLRVWLRAMLGELSYIESDWEAVRWALGSMHVLFTFPGGNTMTMAQIPEAAKALNSRMTQRTWAGGAGVITMALFFTRLLSRVTNTLQRTGCALLVIALLYMLFQLVSARPHKGRVGTSLLVQAAHYGFELGREWNFHRGFSFWSRLIITIPGFLLLAIGGIVANPDSLTRNAIQVMLFVVFAALAIPNNQRFANRYASQLQELEHLQNKQLPKA